jgi:hypothetical protein
MTRTLTAGVPAAMPQSGATMSSLDKPMTDSTAAGAPAAAMAALSVWSGSPSATAAVTEKGIAFPVLELRPGSRGPWLTTSTGMQSAFVDLCSSEAAGMPVGR